MWGVGRTQVHGIGSRKLVYKEVVEVRSNYKSNSRKSYFWWFGNPTCGDSSGSNSTEKDQDHVSPMLIWGNGGEGVVWFSVFVERLYMIGLIGDYVVLFTYGMVLIPWEVGPALWNGSGI